MRLSRLRTWDEQAEDDTTERKAELDYQMLGVMDELEVYESPGAAVYEEMLRHEQQRAFVDMMNGDEHSMILARERAKVFSKLLQRKEDLRQDLDRLRSERNSLEK